MAYPGIRREPRRFAVLKRLQQLRDRVPVDCLLCGERTVGGLCGSCRRAVCASMETGSRCPRCDLHLVDGPASTCPDCVAVVPSFERVVAAFDYAWPGELLIHRLKRQHRYSCAPVLAALLAERCERARSEAVAHDLKRNPALASSGAGGHAVLWCPRSTLVVPVPASRRALVLRGYNPAAEVGRELARRLGLAWRPDLLRRVREAGFQKGLGRHARREGVAGLYASAGPVAGHDVLVVDDVMTTGSTLHAVATVLKAAGARKVWGAVPARTPLREVQR